MKRYRGSCRCGLIRFECELGEHSPACGSSFITRSFHLLEGDHALDMDEAGSGSVQHFYCSQCASPLVWRENTRDGMLYAVPLQALADPVPLNMRVQEVNSC